MKSPNRCYLPLHRLFAVMSLYCLMQGSLRAEVDLDGNGLGDVWERRYQVSGLLPDDDDDGDGRSNLEENRAGTDPLDSAALLQFESAELNDQNLELSWLSEKGKRYLVQLTKNFVNWEDAVPTQDGTGEAITLELRERNQGAGLLGGINRDVWLKVEGTVLSDLTDHPNYPTLPSGTYAMAESASPEDEGDDYGARFRGYLIPPASGNFTLALEAFDAGKLMVSRSASQDGLLDFIDSSAGGRVTRSAELDAGTLYYFEIVHKAGRGADHCKLLWEGPGVEEMKVIGGDSLAFWLGNAAIDQETPLQFYRLQVDDVDTDEDGASDWEEEAMGYHPFDPESQKEGVLDGESLIKELGGGESDPAIITYEVLVENGYEEGSSGSPAAAEIQVNRSGGTLGETLVVPISYTGTATLGEDFDAPGTVTFDANVTTVELTIAPEQNPQIEVPETVIFEAVPGEAYEIQSPPLVINIEDQEIQERTLYVAALTPESGVDSSASGVSSLWLSGDRLSCTVALSFQGLTSEQTAVHIHLSDSGAAIESLEQGQIEEHLWVFPDGGQGSLTSAQAIVDALTTGRFYVNVHSSNYPAGEIRGDYVRSDGSDVFVPPADPPELPDYEGDDEIRDIVRLLTQATFGATEEALQEVQKKGIEAWIDEQMNHEVVLPTNLLDYNQAADQWEVAGNDQLGVDGSPAYDPEFQPRHNNRRRGWFLGAIKGKDQLRQRVAFALSEIFVISDENTKVRTHQYGAAHYYDLLAEHSFGNFRDLLEDVTLHPMMGNYLSMIYNEKANPELGTSPDENYAREVMQLFSIGLVQLHPDGSIKLDVDSLLPIATYDNHVITELARVFTGWSYAKRWAGDLLVDNTRFYYGGGPRYNTGVTTAAMKVFPEFHDTGEKAIVGGTTIPAGQTGEKDMADTLDALFQHPNTPPFIARRLIQRLVTSNPSRGYVYRVARIFENNGSGERGDLGAVVKTILTDYEARSLEVAADPEFGKQREPLIRFMSIMRSLNTNTALPVSDLEAYGFNNAGRFPGGTGRFRFGDTTNLLSQSPLSSPSVFNWFMPGYVFPGVMAEAGMVGPEFQTTTETWVVKSANYKYGLLFAPNGLGLQAVRGDRSNDDHAIPDFAPLQAVLDANGVEGLIDHLNMFWSTGAMTEETKAVLLDVVSNTSDTLKLKTAIYLTVVSPDFIIQR
ncbi:MAG: hypothetical protein ACI9R3_000564 [Verrucomicrobiales bacterium]|jgi:uncharacterized protein (DUF1800 family)